MTLDEAFNILGLARNASLDEARIAYRTLVAKWHPDRLGDVAQELKDFATEQVKRINVAFSIVEAALTR